MTGKNLATSDERFSKNKAKYFTLDFDNVTEKGLKKLISGFEKQDCKVAEVEATNRTIKKDNLATKKALLRFENGQTVTLTFGDQGDVIETKLNAAIIPVTNLETLDGYVKEVGTKAKANQDRFDNSLAAKAKKVVDTSNKKPAGRTIAARLLEANMAQAAAQNNVTKIKTVIADRQAALTTKQGDLERLQKELDVERATTNQLIEQIEHLGGSVA